jgi:NCAIR mutase (PurE)-related protein
MVPDSLKRALKDYKEGRLSYEEIESLLQDLPYEDLGFAKVDHHRPLRQGFAEVIFGRGKTHDQILGISEAILSKSSNLLITRGSEEVFQSLREKFPEAEFHSNCRAITVVREETSLGRGTIGIFSAGTADISVAEEAAVTARVTGNEVFCCYDVGVAGLHRILRQTEALRSCNVVVAVAGMEGALPSVIGGLVEVPVIAVPTSVGYGASFEGLAALLGMLNSCASNVTVVNIDNGFGAGYVASLINRKR